MLIMNIIGESLLMNQVINDEDFLRRVSHQIFVP